MAGEAADETSSTPPRARARHFAIPDRFQPVAYLGRMASGFSHAVHARDRRARNGDNFVAVLVTPLELASTSYIRNQARIHEGLRHPNIVPFLDALETRTHFLIVHGYPDGAVTLHKLLERGPLPQHEAWTYFRQLAAAVSYLHERCIVHRQITLKQCLVKDAGTPGATLQLMGFEFSRSSDDSLLGSLVGDDAYLAPELLQSAINETPYDGFAVDRWACGVCLYNMLWGVNARIGLHSGREAIEVVIPDQLPSDGQLSPKLQDLLRLLLAMRPDERIPLQEVPDVDLQEYDMQSE